jgi:hypothetical protein
MQKSMLKKIYAVANIFSQKKVPSKLRKILNDFTHAKKANFSFKKILPKNTPKFRDFSKT